MMMPTIPIKLIAYFVGFLILIGSVSVGFYSFGAHERDVQHTKDTALQRAALDKQIAIDNKVIANAQIQISALRHKVTNALLTPVTPGIVVRMCLTAPYPDAPPSGHAGHPVSVDAAGGSGHGVGERHPESINIAPFTEEILHRDKVMIDGLQQYVRICKRAGVCQ